MDPFEELERMALNAVAEYTLTSDAEPSHDEIERWQRLFRYSYSDAADQLRCNLARARITDEHWDLVRLEKEADGYDREAYEHSMQNGQSTCSQPNDQAPEAESSGRGNNAVYIFKLGGPLAEPRQIQTAAGLSSFPNLIKGFGEQGISSFCRVDTMAKRAIEEWLSREQVSYKPTFIRLSKARKELSSASSYPRLGQDSTLPQHRLSCGESFPAQDEYPVWYFFYGALADPVFLAGLFSVPEAGMTLLPATISGGVVKTWVGKYKALFNEPAEAVLQGSAFRVESREHEQELLFYETEKYEVVRCTITLSTGEAIQGCTQEANEPPWCT
ncbi:hypothetical protein MMC30_005469 [Trapelia coarctata]|nr:hypothetical protein [Trapelia coarctata]